MKTLAVLLVLVYSVGKQFDYDGFLAASKQAGIKLQADGPTDSPNGDVMLSQGKLTINLHEAPRAVVRDEKHAERSTPGRQPLTGRLEGYRSKITTLVSAHDPGAR